MLFFNSFIIFNVFEMNAQGVTREQRLKNGKSGQLGGEMPPVLPSGGEHLTRRRAKDTNAAPGKATREENKTVASPSISGQEVNTEAT